MSMFVKIDLTLDQFIEEVMERVDGYGMVIEDYEMLKEGLEDTILIFKDDDDESEEE